ncbi:hypothetical protein MTO96_023687 [Rhipicephalus appendiculatus]
MGKGQSKVEGATQGDSGDKETGRFKVGDRVAVTMDVENFRLLQNDYGGWEAQMSLIFGNVGIVQRLLPSGGLMVNYKVANATWQLNPIAVEKLIAYKTGDKVRVCVTLEAMKELQKGHGGYNENMRPEPAPNSSMDNSVSSSSKSSGDDSAEEIGGLEGLRQAIEGLGREEVASRESPLHTVCYHGNEEMAKTLIDAGNDVNVKDRDGDTPLHYCAYGNEPGVMRLLVTARADLNAVNDKNRTPLHVAASKEHADCVRTLLSYSRRINVNIQDADGDTALHDAITVDSTEIASLLIDFRAMDLSLKNKRGFNSLHHACLKGNHEIAERILSKRPNLLNVAKNDGYTALHLAAVNGHIRVAKTLLAKRQCDMNAQASKGETPLMVAAIYGHWDIVRAPRGQQLIALRSSGTSNSRTLSAIAQELPNERLAPLCYLANRGADVYIMNKKGISPMIMAAATDISEYIAAPFTASEASRASRRSSASPQGGEKCKICVESEANVVFKPCGHRMTCQECCIRCKVCLTCAVPVQAKVNLDGTPVRSREQNQTTQKELDRRLQELEDRHTCNICMEKPRDVVFLCGHGSCKACAGNLDRCHMCRVPIERKIDLYVD